MLDSRNYVLLISIARADNVVPFPPFVAGLKAQNFFVSAIVEFYGALKQHSFG